MLVLFALLCLPAFSLDEVVLTVGGLERKALAYVPRTGRPGLPVVLCYHGHGGSAEAFSSRLRLEECWPDSIVVYPQGLNTRSRLVDPEGLRSGWQNSIGEESDRDIAFFDALLSYFITKHLVDPKKVFVLGFSNGGVFAYTVLAARRDRITAIASIAAVQVKRSDRGHVLGKSVFHVAGRHDMLVDFSWQRSMVDYLVRRNGCALRAVERDGRLESYESRGGVQVLFYIDEGAHDIPPEAIPLIADFFKTHRSREGNQ